ncbi:MAG: protein-disulfide reductase DsbD N-terminal domain-containing protein [Bryobacter sp.]|jgi:hypothetical protein|nr:protein-disulfide reductase DsbD N-terminal domain-containing protein [Bryobacter sp.]
MTTLLLVTLLAGEWSKPAVVEHDDRPAMVYRARWDGTHVVVEVTPEPGWHTFAMDNRQRHEEKLAGKPSLGVEKSTSIAVEDGLAVTGAWRQSPPEDFSKPELRIFTFGFLKRALFAAPARKTGDGPATVTVKGQACRASVCLNVSVTLEVGLAGAPGAVENVAGLIAVRGTAAVDHSH